MKKADGKRRFSNVVTGDKKNVLMEKRGHEKVWRQQRGGHKKICCEEKGALKKSMTKKKGRVFWSKLLVSVNREKKPEIDNRQKKGS